MLIFFLEYGSISGSVANRKGLDSNDEGLDRDKRLRFDRKSE